MTASALVDKANRWYALAVFILILTGHQVDKTVMSVIVEPVKHEFGISDARMGVLTGLAQSLGLCLCILPMGWLVDRHSRVKILAAGVILWSGLTALGAAAGSFAILALSRFGVGAAESSAPPACISMISDMFGPKERPMAMGFYYIHVALGTGVIFLGGGYIAHHYGWRTDLLLAGAPGVILGLILLTTVREPWRESHKIAPPPSFAAFLGMATKNRFLLFVLIGGATASIAQASTWAWITSFFIRDHGLTLTQTGILSAVAAGLGKGIGAGISGPLVRLSSGGRSDRLWRSPATMLTLSVPVGWLMVTTGSTETAMIATVILGVLLGGWAAPTIVILVAGMPTRIRGSSVSLYYMTTNLIGAGFGPVVTGAMSDAFGGKAGIGKALAVSLSVNLIAALSLFIACRTLAGRADAAALKPQTSSA
jgi:MFS family permease